MSRISCSICYDLISSESILLHLDCGHIYHDHCLTQWMKTSRTCPECRKRVIKMPSRVYPNFDGNDDDTTLQLTSNIEVLENKNKKLEEQLTQLHMNQHEIIIAQLAKKTYEVIKMSNSLKSMEQLYTDSKRKTEELTRSNEVVTERLKICCAKLDNVNDLLSAQKNESTTLASKIVDLEKQLQFAESDAQMDKYFRTVAVNEKEEVTDQLNDTQRQLFYAQNTIERNLLQIETIVGELERLRTEKQMQSIRMKQMEQTICERDMERREVEQENVQLKSQLKQMIRQGLVNSSDMAEKRKLKDCGEMDFANKHIKQEFKLECNDNAGQPPIKLIIRKIKTDSHFSCKPVL